MEWGPQEDWFHELSRSGNLDTPLLRKPDVAGHLLWIWQGFWRLSASRPVGMAESAIPFTDVVAYMQWRNMSAEEQEEFSYHVGRLDGAFLRSRAK